MSSNITVYIANPEEKTVHNGVSDENFSVKFDPRCNVPTARSAGEEETRYIERSEGARLVAEEGYKWCGHCCLTEAQGGE